ncbi:Crp/Fnr family transcriptional regulator [Dactylosporangium sp. CA-233914]|uniref:Crp/Fnr family transcriptional regulator n=1 Tax=Dactylosporangium sp. CA-233914 TaxID=3239934 RepID=UPI003D8EA68D
MDDSLFAYPGAPPVSGEAALLRDAGDRAWALVREHAPARRFRAGETVLAAGAAERCLWIVAEGRVATGTGAVGPGGVFGELGFLDGEPAPATVRALTGATVLRLTLERFEVLAGQDPALARHLLFDLARGLALRLRDLRRLV